MAERRLTFVVAEDEERMREYLARKTRELDPAFECVGTAADGEEAVELVERHLPELLITDIKMPVLGGLELVERIRRTNPELRILIVSGYSEFEYARRAIELGVDDYLLKPVAVEKLREVLRRIRIRLEASAGSVDVEFGMDRIGARETELAKEVECYLQENYRRPYSLERLASSFGCKPAYLLRLYRKVTGRTPTQDLIHLRVEKAKRLLVGHPHIEVKQVAAAVGYEDPLYFSRLFRRETGIAPSAFRESRGR
ncbi:MAG TPA: response regulator [Spirochaetia bacterium]|nr:response regulator [Spirochaetia bacterium]